jgi:AraC-like DNA-binding protein
VPADELRDRTPDLDQLWPAAPARRLAEQIAADLVAGLEAWLAQRVRSAAVDPLGPRVLALATTGTPVAVMADRLGCSERQLRRRCLPLFGYGPRRLARTLRLGRAIEAARTGTPPAQVAAECGYADQAHLSREVRDLTGATLLGLVREARRG